MIVLGVGLSLLALGLCAWALLDLNKPGRPGA